VQQRDNRHQDGQAATRLVELMNELADIQRGEDQHARGNQPEQPADLRPQPNRGGQAQGDHHGDDHEADRLRVDAEKLFAGV
jgi:hypothetical protein